MLSRPGANFGGVTITQAPSAWIGIEVPCSVTEAVMGPSDTSSNQRS